MLRGVDATVSALWIYPVKSCRGIPLTQSAVEARGLRSDRRWMIVDDSGIFITQRTEPRLALVEVAVEYEGQDGADEPTLILRAPDEPDLRVAAHASAGDAATGRRRVTVWRDEVDAIDCGDEAKRWISRWLGSSASLVFMPDDVRRPVKPAYARPTDIVGFADGFPLLVASTSSLDDLNARMDRPVPMDRFRPNIVLTGAPAWAEDTWTRILVGAVPVRMPKPCDRCVITTTDQRTAERGVEPLRTLASFRRVDGKVFFAQNGVPDAAGSVRVGDAVTVLEATGAS
jgi:uncharacterized protein YcbX